MTRMFRRVRQVASPAGGGEVCRLRLHPVYTVVAANRHRRLQVAHHLLTISSIIRYTHRIRWRTVVALMNCTHVIGVSASCPLPSIPPLETFTRPWKSGGVEAQVGHSIDGGRRPAKHPTEPLLRRGNRNRRDFQWLQGAFVPVKANQIAEL